jgi:hypothetical protein
VVGWQLASHMRASLVCHALKMAVCTRPRGANVKLVHHSDSETARVWLGLGGLTGTAIESR